MATPALKAKELGNKAYKSKKFKEAIKHYDEAIVLDPTDITFYNNKGGECGWCMVKYYITVVVMAIVNILSVISDRNLMTLIGCKLKKTA